MKFSFTNILKISLCIVLFSLAIYTPINTVKASNEVKVLDGRTIMLDPGHGGKDPGAIQNGFKEKNLNNNIAKKISKKLTDLGAKIIYTRNPNEDIYLTLAERCEIANKSNADLFLSIHHDSSVNKSAKGFSVHYSSYRPGIELDGTYLSYNNKTYPLIKEEGDYFYYQNGNKTEKVLRADATVFDSTPSLAAKYSLDFSNKLQSRLDELVFIKRRLKKPYDHNLYVTRWTNMPSALIEVGFISNYEEVHNIVKPENQEIIANKIVEAIKESHIGTSVKGVEIAPSTVNLAVGNKFKLSSKITPSNAIIKDVTWKSTNPQIVTVNQSGELTALSKGETNIIVTTKENSHTDQITVRVTRYSDVPKSHWAYNRIEELSSNGMFNGYSDGTFKPNNNLTRAQAAVLLVKAANIDYVGKVSEFTDVPANHWATAYIAAAKEAGILNGYGDKFKPNDNITRAQMAVMMSKAFNLQNMDTQIDFKDVSDNHWASKYIEILSSNKIVSGYEDGTFKPNNPTTRAQFSKILSIGIEK